jgi:uncharacterized protein
MEHELLHPQEIVVVDDLVEEVCWRLLATADVARVGFVRDDDSWILPVNVRLMGRAVVFRTAADSMLHALAPGTPVVVEVDHVDAERRTGWSVLVRGEIEEVTPELLPVVDGSVVPWAPGEHDRWMWVVGKSISGRSISRRGPPPKFRLPYMALG